MIAERSVFPLLHYCALAVQRACRNNTACNKIIIWSIVRSCGDYEQGELEGTAEMVEFSAGLQTQQEERYVISLFLILLGGSFTRFFMTFALPY